jgi:hypothetical protein
MTKLIIYNNSPYFYHISQIVYDNFKNYMTNDEIQLVNCNKNYIFTDNVYLTFIPFEKWIPKKYIVYNFEQFTTDKIWDISYIYFLKNAIYTIDYSILNIIRLSEYNINSYFLPYMPHKINKYTKNVSKDIDILFIGNLNKRRLEWLNQLSNFNIKIINNIFFDNSLELLARSKILLNIHYYNGDTILEVPRILPGLENNCIILSETSNEEYYDNLYKDIIKWTTKKNIIDDINNILTNYDKLIEINNEKFHHLTTNINYSDITELISFLKIL